jgi:DeoR family ulaG and ulaABCDEF operon transcriptional repressor
MLERERQELILRLLRQSRFATVTELVAASGASEATVRRDLGRLEQMGALRRIRGGAEAAEVRQAPQQPFELRKGLLLEKKRAIGRRAAALCQDGETVFIDGGSTTYQMAEFLRSSRLQILTNSFAIAQVLIGCSANTVILAGGVVYPDSQLILDPFQEDAFRNYYASKVFMGLYGIDELGATNTDLLLIRTEKAMIDHARELVILADSSKIGRRGSLKLCAVEQIHTFITDGGIGEAQRQLLVSRGVRLLTA